MVYCRWGSCAPIRGSRVRTLRFSVDESRSFPVEKGGLPMFPNQSIRSVGITVVLLASCVCGRSLPAQPPVAYKPWPVDATLEAKKRDVFSALERGNFDANRAENEKFFKSYYFARWTDSANESNLYSFRNDFLKTDAGKITGNARNYLLGYALAELGAIAADKAVFPAGRYNAILAIGMLDQKAGESSSSQPTAYPEALSYLVKEHENAENAPFIRLGALLGIVRHAQSGIGDAAQRQAVFALLCRVLDEGKPNEERSADDQEMLDWNRSLAVSGLQSLRMSGRCRIPVGNRPEWGGGCRVAVPCDPGAGGA